MCSQNERAACCECVIKLNNTTILHANRFTAENNTAQQSLSKWNQLWIKGTWNVISYVVLYTTWTVRSQTIIGSHCRHWLEMVNGKAWWHGALWLRRTKRFTLPQTKFLLQNLLMAWNVIVLPWQVALRFVRVHLLPVGTSCLTLNMVDVHGLPLLPADIISADWWQADRRKSKLLHVSCWWSHASLTANSDTVFSSVHTALGQQRIIQVFGRCSQK